jgi:hypothetical protein
MKKKTLASKVQRRTLELKKETIVELTEDRLKLANGGNLALDDGTNNSACCTSTQVI